MAAFEEFGVMPELGAAVEEMEWTLPTDVQAEAIPLILGGGDVLMAAETGSGKTGAFCLPVLQVTWESLKELQEGKGRGQVSGGAKEAETRWGMSFFDRGPALAVSQDGLRCQSREMKEWHGARATRGVVGGGKHYYEATVTDEGLCRVGVATGEASLDLGTCRHGFGFGGTGKKSNNKQFDSYGGSYGKADTIGVYLDLDNMEVWYSKNGEDLGQAFAISPDLRGQVFYPAVVLKNAEMLFNFGDSAFKHPPVEGYQGFREAEQGRLVSNPKGSGGAGVTERKKVNNAPQALIIEPSRELADQTYSQLGLFQAKLPSPGVSTLLLVGGVRRTHPPHPSHPLTPGAGEGADRGPEGRGGHRGGHAGPPGGPRQYWRAQPPAVQVLCAGRGGRAAEGRLRAADQQAARQGAQGDE